MIEGSKPELRLAIEGMQYTHQMSELVFSTENHVSLKLL
jgi:hypothetical protein